MKSIIKIIAVLMAILTLSGCTTNNGFEIPKDMTREEAALFTAIAEVCPKDDNHSKVDYLTFYIEGWSFDEIPEEINDYLVEYAANGNARLVQLSFEELEAEGYIVNGDGDFFKEDEKTYKLGKGKIFTFTKYGDSDSDSLVVKLEGYISDNDCSGYDIILNYTNGAWVFEKYANPWGEAYMQTPEPGETEAPPEK